MGMNENFRYLSIGLPGDIERRKQAGDFERAIRLIDERLESNVPEALKKCMIVERELMCRITADYPFTRAQALEQIHRDCPDFTEAEFDRYVDEGKIDWIYVNGEERYFEYFYPTLVKAWPEYIQRAGIVKEEKVDSDKKYEDEAIAQMKEKGKVSWRFQVRATIRLKDECFVPGKVVRAYLPIPSNGRQISDIVIHSHSDYPCTIAPVDAPQRTICFETALNENDTFFVEYSYTNTVSYNDAYNGTGIPGTYDFDLEELQPHVVFTPYIQELVKSLVGEEKDPLKKARIFYDFITKTVRYSYMREYFGLTQIAENCARNLRGDCGVQGLLFITLCRAAGIPARWQSGLTSTPNGMGPHDWTEFYVEPYGWLFADPSYGGGAHRKGNELRRQFYFGNLDPFRMVANTEFQGDLIPDMRYWRADPYDNQTGEMEYEDGALSRADYKRTKEVLSAEQLF